jgi:hypothetical protein
MFDHDYELEKRYHPENFGDCPDIKKITFLDKKGKITLEFGKIGNGKFKYGMKKHK